MRLSLSSEILKPFFAQLFQNIGYSKKYKRYIVVEPVCYLTGRKHSITKCVPIDPIVYGENLGTSVASFIDEEGSDHLEQVLIPYISDTKYKYILLNDNPIVFSRGRLPEFLKHLKKEGNILPVLKGLVHYHIDEPRLSKGDIDAMVKYTREVKLLHGLNQIGIVLSERNPEDTLKVANSGKKKFIEHLSTKLRTEKIDLVGELFTGKPGFHSHLEIRIKF